jgi:nitrite reductase/ring-hydroxylating ferredoxin subunit
MSRRETTVEPNCGARDQDWVDIGDVADLAGSRLETEIDGLTVLVLRDGAAVVAMVATCPHMGHSLLDARIAKSAVTCAGHGYCWSLRSGRPNSRRPGLRPLRLLPVGRSLVGC